MFFPIPLGAEAELRKLPYATFALLVVNILVFALTTMRSPPSGNSKEEAKLERLAAWELEKVGQSDAALKRKVEDYPLALDFLVAEEASWNERVEDADSKAMLTQILADYQALRADDVVHQHGLVPADASLTSAFTSMFMHGDLMHLFFNMLFLWVAGCLLENTWDTPLFATLYVVFGLVAGAVFVLSNPDTTTPAIGASGAIAGLMGAFAVHHPRTRLRVALVYGLGMAPRFRMQLVPAWLLLLAWILQQVFFASLMSEIDAGVAFSAHIGGFVAGLVGALLVRVLARGELGQRVRA